MIRHARVGTIGPLPSCERCGEPTPYEAEGHEPRCWACEQKEADRIADEVIAKNAELYRRLRAAAGIETGDKP